MRTEDGLGCQRKFASREEYDKAVCYHPACLSILYTENIFGAMYTNKGITIGGTTINNLRYADDTVLLAETEEDLQEILNDVYRIGKTFDMKMNANKAKTMLVSKNVTLTKVSLTKVSFDINKQTDRPIWDKL